MDGRERAIIGMGTNLGDREANLLLAARLLAAEDGVDLVAVSPVYVTRPMGPSVHEFLNAAALVDTSLDPAALLDRLAAIEGAAGRPGVREKWGPRSLDLDVLLMGLVVREDPPPRLPHPGLLARDFALRPALDLVPDLVDPVTSRPLSLVLECLAERWILSGPRPLPARVDYRLVDHTADVGLEVRAPDRDRLMAAAAMALADAISPRDLRRETERVRVRLESVDAEMALVDLLQEVVYLFDARRFLPVRAECRLGESAGGMVLEADLFGSRADPGSVRMAPKAATHHGLEIGTDRGGWRALVYLDV